MQPPDEEPPALLSETAQHVGSGTGAVTVSIKAAGEDGLQVMIAPVGEQESKATVKVDSHGGEEESSACTGGPRMCGGPATTTTPNAPISPTEEEPAQGLMRQIVVESSAISDNSGAPPAAARSLPAPVPVDQVGAGPVAESGPGVTDTPLSEQAHEHASGKEGAVGVTGWLTKLREVCSKGFHGCYALRG